MTDLGDEVLLRFSVSYSSDLQTHISIMDISMQKELESFNITGDYVKHQVIRLVNSSTVRCYQVSKYILIYKVNNREFKGVVIGNIKDIKVEANSDLIIASKELIGKKEWKWLKMMMLNPFI